MIETDTERTLSKVLADFERRRPIRAGSLIITVFGDAVVPRGGSLWLGSLLEIMAEFGIEPGLVRTALSRHVAEGWFERRRIGKSSFYRLSAQGEGGFAAATRRIYHLAEQPWDGGLRLAIISSREPRQRTALRDQLAQLGFGQAAPTVLLRPTGTAVEPEPKIAETIWLDARVERDLPAARALGATCWQLDELEAAYRRFIGIFGPLAAQLGETREPWSQAEAFRLRILLIHEYRRIILRDPLLPREMLPEDWPGATARGICRDLYRLAVIRSEEWLEAHAKGERGALPPPVAEFATRFAGD